MSISELAGRYDYPINVEDHFDVQTVTEFLAAVKAGAFTDYDGFGYPVREGMYMDERIYPSKVWMIPSDATHITWFNR